LQSLDTVASRVRAGNGELLEQALEAMMVEEALALESKRNGALLEMWKRLGRFLIMRKDVEEMTKGVYDEPRSK
jgi:hypothetical protein